MSAARAKPRLRGGIDLGGTKIQAAIVTPEGEVVGNSRGPTPTKGGPADVVEAMADALREAAQAASVDSASLEGVGVGAPGQINDATGEVAGAVNLPGWDGSFGVTAALAEALGVPARVGNDVNVATNAEFVFGAGRPYSSMLGVFWGTGVGGGIILDGKPWLGRGAAGEIGHVVVEIGGAHCPCGRRGCMEAYAGRGAMEAKAREEHADGTKTDLFKIMEKKGRERLSSSVWEKALEQDDHLAKKLIDRAVKALGAGVASAVNLLDVEAVIFGGGLGLRLGQPYVDKIADQMSKHLFAEQPPAIVLAELGDLGGAIGASLLVADR